MTTGNKQYISSLPGSYVERTDVWSGTDGRKNPDGSVKDNAYTRTRSYFDQKYQAGIACYYWSPTPNSVCGSVRADSVGSLSSVWTSNDTNMLMNKLASKVRSHDFNAGVFLGELSKTTSHVVNTITSVRRVFLGVLTQKTFGFVNVKTGRKRKVTQDDISDAYLQTVFGTLPLISDTIESVKAFGSTERKSRVVATHSVVRRIDSSPSPSVYNAYGGFAETQKIMYEMSERMSFARELGLLDPASVLWELTPWSFLFDYFMPVGTYLENLAVIPNLKGRFIHTRKRTFQSVTGAMPPKQIYVNPWDQKTYYYDLYGASSSAYEFSEFTRTPMTGLSVPSPNFRTLPEALMPGRRIANVIALSHQQVLKFLKKNL